MAVAGMFCQAVVVAVLLYDSDSWVLPPSGLQVLEGFHIEETRHMPGMRPQQRTVSLGFLQNLRMFWTRHACEAGRNLHHTAPSQYIQNNQGAYPSRGVQGGREEARQSSLSVLVGIYYGVGQGRRVVARGAFPCL